MNLLKKIGALIQKFLEEYLCGFSFVAMLCVMFYSVITRYLFNRPLKWALEFESVCFMFIVFLGIGLAEHEGSTVEFDMIYEKFSKPVQAFCRLLGNVLTVVFFSVCFLPCTKYVFKVTSPTPVLKIPRVYVFFPFVIMMAGIILRHAMRSVADIKSIVNKTYIQTYGKSYTPPTASDTEKGGPEQ